MKAANGRKGRACVALVGATIGIVSVLSTLHAVDTLWKSDVLRTTAMRDLPEAVLAVARLKGHVDAMRRNASATVAPGGVRAASPDVVVLEALAHGLDELDELALRLADRSDRVAEIRAEFSSAARMAIRSADAGALIAVYLLPPLPGRVNSIVSVLSDRLDALAAETGARIRIGSADLENLALAAKRSLFACLMLWTLAGLCALAWSIVRMWTVLRNSLDRRTAAARDTAVMSAPTLRPWPGSQYANAVAWRMDDLACKRPVRSIPLSSHFRRGGLGEGPFQEVASR